LEILTSDRSTTESWSKRQLREIHMAVLAAAKPTAMRCGKVLREPGRPCTQSGCGKLKSANGKRKGGVERKRSGVPQSVNAQSSNMRHGKRHTRSIYRESLTICAVILLLFS